MFVSLKKNTWLVEWVLDVYGNELHDRYVVPHKESMLKSKKKYDEVHEIKKQFAIFLSAKGYKSKYFAKTNDVIITMKDSEYTFLKIKYD